LTRAPHDAYLSLEHRDELIRRFKEKVARRTRRASALERNAGSKPATAVSSKQAM
jgi:hypothetical protein